jgi:hypothetical protein
VFIARYGLNLYILFSSILVSEVLKADITKDIPVPSRSATLHNPQVTPCPPPSLEPANIRHISALKKPNMGWQHSDMCSRFSFITHRPQFVLADGCIG